MNIHSRRWLALVCGLRQRHEGGHGTRQVVKASGALRAEKVTFGPRGNEDC